MIKSSPLRTAVLFLTAFILFGYSKNDTEVRKLKTQIDSLHTELDNYKPGFGSIMMDIQAHHSKLWFAGSSQNWELAEFQIHEIEEAIEDIEKFHSSRPEAKTIAMLENAVEKVHSALESKSPVQFESSFKFLTQNCNSCHQASNVGFNVIKVPQNNSFNNQVFAIE